MLGFLCGLVSIGAYTVPDVSTSCSDSGSSLSSVTYKSLLTGSDISAQACKVNLGSPCSIFVTDGSNNKKYVELQCTGSNLAGGIGTYGSTNNMWSGGMMQGMDQSVVLGGGDLCHYFERKSDGAQGADGAVGASDGDKRAIKVEVSASGSSYYIAVASWIGSSCPSGIHSSRTRVKLDVFSSSSGETAATTTAATTTAATTTVAPTTAPTNNEATTAATVDATTAAAATTTTTVPAATTVAAGTTTTITTTTASTETGEKSAGTSGGMSTVSVVLIISAVLAIIAIAAVIVIRLKKGGAVE